MPATEAINAMVMSILSGAFLLVFGLLGLIWSRIEKVGSKVESTKDEVIATLTEALGKVNELMEREKKEFIIADKRLNIHDRVTSAISDKPFDSKLIATGSGEIPSTKRIQKLMDTERVGRA